MTLNTRSPQTSDHFPNPLLLEFLDNPEKKNRRFVLTAEFIYQHGSDCIRIQPGYPTDFASIPKPLWPILSPTGLYGKAAVIHDYLCDVCHDNRYQYDTGDMYTRAEADKIFLDAMTSLNVAPWKRYPMYWAVRADGARSELWANLQRTKTFCAMPSCLGSRVAQTSFLFSITLLILLLANNS